MSALSGLWDFFTTGSNWTGPKGIGSRTWAQAWISFVAVVVACAISVPPAMWLAHRRKAPVLSVAVVNIGRAIPSFAIVALVLPISIKYGFGLGFWPTLVALVALGVPPIFTNTYAGIAGTPAELVEAARGVGMTESELLRQVELPVGLPLFLTGLRISAVQIVATATLGALVGYECLGTYIIEGLQRPRSAQGRLLGGALLVSMLAVTVEFALNRIEPVLLPWRRRVR